MANYSALIDTAVIDSSWIELIVDILKSYQTDVVLKKLNVEKTLRYILDRAESLDGWSHYNCDSISLDDADKREGDYSVKVTKNSTSVTWYGVRYTLASPMDITMYDFFELWFKLNRSDIFNAREYFLRDYLDARIGWNGLYPSSWEEWKLNIKSPDSKSLNICSKCDALGSWVGTDISIDTSDKMEGTGSLKDVVSNPVIDTDYDTYWNAIWNQLHWSYRKKQFWLKCDRPSTAFTYVRFYQYDASNNYKYWNLIFNANEWTLFTIDWDNPDGSSGGTQDRATLKPHFVFCTADTTGFTKHIDYVRCGEFDYTKFKQFHWLVSCNTAGVSLSIWVDFLRFSKEGYSIDVILKKLAVEKGYSIDVAIKRLNDLINYAVDTTFSRSDLKNYLIDVLLLDKDKLKQYLIDVSLRDIGIAEYIIDVLLVEETIKQYLLDVVFKDTKIIDYIVDVVLKKEEVIKTYLVDVALKDTRVVEYIIDVLLKEEDNTKQYSIDVPMVKTEIIDYILDAVFRKTDVLEYLIDALIKETNVISQYIVDSVFTSIMTSDYMIDYIGLLETSSEYDVDVLIKKINAILQSQLDVLFQRKDDIKIYSFDLIIVKVIEVVYIVDFLLKKSFDNSYFIDVFLANLFTFSYVLERFVTEACIVAVPEWINQNPSIDTNVWSEKKDRLTLIVRMTDKEKNDFDVLLGKPIKITEGVYVHIVLFDSFEYIWAGNENFERPWKATLEFTILTTEIV